jgi:two-component system, OmpR family, response regulator ArlR
MDSKKILVIEDEKKIARFIELELNHEGYEVRCEINGRAGLEEAQENPYDLLLLDILLPGLNGIEVCRRLRQTSDVPVIMLTAKDDTADIVTGLDIGANDYITKPFAIEELLARIRSALRQKRGGAKRGESFCTDGLSVDPAKHVVKRDGTVIELTRLEFELLLYLIKNKGIVLTRDQILESVWGFDYAGETNVVDVYINYLRNKIDKDKDNKLIVTVRGIGYSIKDEDSRENQGAF